MYATTKHALEEIFDGPSLSTAVSSICKACIHCVVTRGDKMEELRALGHAMHATERHTLLHFDMHMSA